MRKADDKIFDMTHTCVISGRFYECISKGVYRVMATVCSDDYQIVKNKAMINRLDKIFKGKNE
jgi:hypothetical protein